MKEEKISGLSYGIVLMAMAGGIALGLIMSSNFAAFKKPVNSSLQYKVDETMHLIQNEYVDVIDEDSVADVMLNAMLLTLDPHSRYASAKEVAKEMEQLTGQFEGVGMTLRRIKDTTCVGSLFDNSPAAKAGLLPGDRIITVDTTNVCGPKIKADDVVKLIRGPKRSKVELGVVRRGVEGVRHYTLYRQNVKAPSMDYHTMLENKTGYIKVSSFGEDTYSEFREALQSLKNQGMQRLVLDLRGNGGGLLDAAVGIASELLPKGSMIVYTQGAHSWRSEMKSPGGGIYTEGDLTVMIDEGSASASEIVSGAIQDNDRGLIVGRRSFGKGLVQRKFSLNDGSALMLTVSKYYTPSGRCIQRPYKDGVEEYYRSNISQILKENMSDSIDATLGDTVKYHTKNGRVVYGGGGIVPDKLLPLQRYDDVIYYNTLLSKGIILEYAFDQISNHVSELMKRYPTVESFEKGYQVSDGMLQEIVERGKKAGVETQPKYVNEYARLIKIMTKAYIAQSLYGEKGFYKIYLQMDDELKKVVNKMI